MVTLVVGATGFLGSEICRQLVTQGKSVRALVRPTTDESKINSLKSQHVTLAYGDLKTRKSLEAACQGVTAVITTATTTASRQPDDSIEATDRDGHLNLVETAKVAGVRRFIYTSYSGNMDRGREPCPLTVAKRTVEQAVLASGMTYTILRPSYFMEVWLSPALGFDPANAKVTIYGTGHNPISWISLSNVAEFAVQSLDNPAAHNAVIELGGPEALSPLEVVRTFEEISGTQIAVTHVPVEALEAQYSAATDSMQKSFAGLMLSYAAGDPIDMRQILKAFPVALTPVQEYARRLSLPA